MPSEPADFPPPPRPITGRAARRSWAEAPVRGWLVLAVVVAAVVGYLSFVRVTSALRERDLIEHGTPVIARVTKIGLNQARTASRDERMSAEITYTPPGGTQMIVPGELPPKPGKSINLVDDFPIKVDPQHPERWTDLTTPRSVAQQLAAVYVLLPILLATVLAAVWQRRRVLQVFRDGIVSQATVVSTKQSPTAPRSRLVSFTLPGAPLVSTCYWPDRLGRPESGEEIAIIHLPDTFSRAVAAPAYV